jgi:arsenate reductase
MNKVNVLFLCNHNSARSQFAEGLLRHFYGDQYEVFSAGATPTQVNPFAIKAMAEIGIDISKQYSKSVEEFRNRPMELVVSVCKSSAKVVCAFCSPPLRRGRPEIIDEILPDAKRYLDHPFDDPSEIDGTDEEKLAAFRHTRDELKEWILDYFANLKNEGSEKNT